MTSRYHGSKISGSQHSFLIETAICIVELNDGRKVWAIVLFPSAIMRRKVIHVIFFAFTVMFAGPRFIEIEKFCFHGNMT